MELEFLTKSSDDKKILENTFSNFSILFRELLAVRNECLVSIDDHISKRKLRRIFLRRIKKFKEDLITYLRVFMKDLVHKKDSVKLTNQFKEKLKEIEEELKEPI